MEFVIKLYVRDGKSLEEISKIAGVSRPTIKKNLIAHNIEINSKPQFKPFDDSYDTLYRLYIKKGLTLKEMRDALNGDLEKIRIKLNEYGLITDRPTDPLPIPMTEQEMVQLYLIEKRNMSYIARQYNTSVPTIRKWLKHYNIPQRSIKETQQLLMKSAIMPKEDFIKICNEIHQNKYDYSKVVYDRVGSSIPITIICPDHGEFKQRPMAHRTGAGCQKCGKMMSRGEDEICALLAERGVQYIQSWRRGLQGQHEIDIYLPNFNIGIEFDGLYWHSDKFKPASYHLDKTKMADRAGIRLFHVFENEWHNRRRVWEYIIIRSISNGAFADKSFVVRPISLKAGKDFIESNSPEDIYDYGSIFYACIVDQITVLVASFDHNTMINFAYSGWYDGMISSLVKQYKIDYDMSLVFTNTNRRYTTATELCGEGFTHIGHLKPAAHYFYGKSLKLHPFPDKTEQRIWDCGKHRWVHMQ